MQKLHKNLEAGRMPELTAVSARRLIAESSKSSPRIADKTYVDMALNVAELVAIGYEIVKVDDNAVLLSYNCSDMLVPLFW